MKEYEVEKIVDKRTVNKAVQYRVKWKGWSEKDNTWEPMKNLKCPDLIAKFEEAADENDDDEEGTSSVSAKKSAKSETGLKNGSPKKSTTKRSLSPADDQADSSHDSGRKSKKQDSKKSPTKRNRLNSWHSDDIPLAKLNGSDGAAGDSNGETKMDRSPIKATPRSPIKKGTAKTPKNDDDEEEELESSLIASKVTDVKVESGKIVYAVKFSGAGKPKNVSSQRARTTCMPLIVDYFEKKFLEDA
jgi:hypothetical protein